MEPMMTTPQPTTPQPSSGGGRPNKKQQRLIIFGAIAAVVLAVLVWIGVMLYNNYRAAQESEAAEGPTVLIQGDGFKPATITIKAGQDVTWTNQDEVSHTIDADEETLPGLDGSTKLANGDSYTYIFETPGTYHYYDPVDPQVFQGTVVVE